MKLPNFRIPLFRWSWSRRIPAMFRQKAPAEPLQVRVTIIQAPYTPLADAMERKDWQDADTD
jgi:hypothetical protein